MQALESNRRNPGAGTIGLGKGGERIFQRHIPNHAVVRRNLGTASEARAEVEIGRDGDIGRHRGHIERTKEARIDTDLGDIILASDDPAETLGESAQTLVREAAKPDDDTSTRRTLERRPNARTTPSQARAANFTYKRL